MSDPVKWLQWDLYDDIIGDKHPNAVVRWVDCVWKPLIPSPNYSYKISMGKTVTGNPFYKSTKGDTVKILLPPRYSKP